MFLLSVIVNFCIYNFLSETSGLESPQIPVGFLTVLILYQGTL